MACQPLDQQPEHLPQSLDRLVQWLEGPAPLLCAKCDPCDREVTEALVTDVYSGIDPNHVLMPILANFALHVAVAAPAPESTGSREVAEILVPVDPFLEVLPAAVDGACMNESDRSVTGILRDWDGFLDDFHRHWPTDEDHLYVDFIRNGRYGSASARPGNRRWRRLVAARYR